MFRPFLNRPRSLRSQLVGLVLALVLPLIALQTWWAVRELRSAEDIAGTQAVTYANMTATGLLSFLDQTERLLRANVDRLGATYLDATTCEQGVRDLVFGTFLINAFVVDGVGNVRCSARPTPPGTFAGDWEWFPDLEAGLPFVIGAPVAGTLSDAWVLPLVTAISDGGGAFSGAVVASLPLLQFAALLPSVQGVEADLLVTITDANQIVVAHSRNPERVIGGPLPPVLDEATQIDSVRWTVRAPDLEGSSRTWGRMQMDNGWSAYVGIPDEALRGPAVASALRNLMGTFAILLLGIGLATVGYRRIAGSLEHLVSGLRVTDSGGVVVPTPDTPTEVRTVVDEFNQTLKARDAAQQAERDARERYKAIVDNAVFGIYLVTTEGQFLEVNPALVAMLRFDSVEALLEAGAGVLWSAGAVGFKAFHSELSEGSGEGLETVLLRSDLTPVTVRMSGRATTTPTGERAYQMIVQDITEVRQKEHELRQTQKMDAIGKLAGGIAHDFNNLLVVIGGNIDLMRVSLPSDHEMHMELGQVREAVDRAAALTAQLLAFSRKERPEPGRIDLNAILQNMDRMLGRLIGPDIELETRLSPLEPHVRIDRSEMEQVIMNLVLNARDAITTEGRVTIETHLEPWAPAGKEPSEGVLLSVADTGAGMDSATLAHIFEPFYTTKPVGRGTGLGLSTTYAIVQQAGGHTSAESEPGAGSLVKVWLPLATEGSTQSPEPTEGTDMTPGSERILVVEDEELVRVFVKRALMAAGYDVVVASDGREALDIFEDQGDSIDLVLTDVVMPRMRGPELSRRLTALAPPLPVIFMSGYVDPEALQGELSGREDLVLHKPFRAAELCARIRGALDGAADTSGV